MASSAAVVFCFECMLHEANSQHPLLQQVGSVSVGLPVSKMFLACVQEVGCVRLQTISKSSMIIQLHHPLTQSAVSSQPVASTSINTAMSHKFIPIEISPG